MKIYHLIAISIALSACATSPVEQSMETLDGLHISKAVKYLGAPDSKQSVLGNHVYQWKYSNQTDNSSCVITAKATASDMIREMSYIEDSNGCEASLIQARDIIK